MYEHYLVHIGQNKIEISGSANQTVSLDSEGYFQKLFSLPSTKAQQLVSIAAAIYAIDRISKRKSRRHKSGGIRQLYVSFQLKNSSFWSDHTINDLLLDIISFLTDDDWKIDFEEVASIEEVPRHQSYLDLPKETYERIALYSGGLDSAAGLAHQLLTEDIRNYLLVTVGHYLGLHSKVQRQLSEFKAILANQGRSGVRISHATLTTHLKGGKAIRIRTQETSQRSRALLFCATAVSAADVFKVNVVEIFENGVGAINLPVMTGMLGNGCATRGAHPVFLTKMSTLASMILERKLEFSLPFQHLTKGEVLRSIAPIPALNEWVQKSVSCIHTSLRFPGVTHCGECPACIERRQALIVAEIPSDIRKYQIDILKSLPTKPDNKQYFDLYRLDALKWQEHGNDLGRRLDYHLAITEVHSSAHQEIFDLYKRHSQEVIQAFGSPFQIAPKTAETT